MSRGNPRFGYKHENGKLVPCAEEIETIKLIVCMREGDAENTGESYNTISAYLNYQHKLNRGRYWSPTTVRSVYHRSQETLKFAEPREVNDGSGSQEGEGQRAAN